MSNLENIKIGDKVIIESLHWKRLAEVQDITKTGLIKVCGNLYYKDGRLRGGDKYNRTYLRIATEEEIKELQKDEFIKKVLYKMQYCKSITYEQAKEINEILERE